MSTSRAPTAQPSSSAGSTATPTSRAPGRSHAESVAVIGNGNVALDVSRILAKHADDLLPTEIPANVYEGLKASPVTDVHVFGRRGPAQVKFTPLELRELGEVRDVDMVVYDEDFDHDEASKTAIATNKQVMVINRVLEQWRTREVGQASRRLHLHFYAKPLEFVGDEQGKLDRHPLRAHPAERRRAASRAPARSARSRSRPPTARSATSVPRCPACRSTSGTVSSRTTRARSSTTTTSRSPGVYATGWIKRGPVGLIGHTKSDAMETVQHIVNDQASWWTPEDPSEERDPGAARASAVSSTPTSTAGTASTSTSIALGAAAGPRAHQGRAARRDDRRLARRAPTPPTELTTMTDRAPRSRPPRCGARPPRARLSVDVARALALLGMMAAHVGGIADQLDWTDPAARGPPSRTAAPSTLFAVLAGVSIGLVSGRHAPARPAGDRPRSVRGSPSAPWSSS